MFVLVRFEPETTLTEDALEIMPSLSFEQQRYLLERENSYKIRTKEVVVSSYLAWEKAVKALSYGDGEANELPRRKRTGYQNQNQNQNRASCSSLCNLK